MSTQQRAPYVMSRVAARAGLGIWRHRVSVLFGALVVAGLAVYTTTNNVSVGSVASAAMPLAMGGSAATDCADTAMAAIADKSPDAASRAYQCMDTSFQQRVPEDQFVRQMEQQALPNVQKLQRVADYHPTAGGTMVYYAVDGGQQSVGYIVYLGDNGKVLHIE